MVAAATLPKSIPVMVLVPVALAVPVILTACPLTVVVPEEAESVTARVWAVPVELEYVWEKVPVPEVILKFELASKVSPFRVEVESTFKVEAVETAPVLPSTVKFEVSTAIPPSRLTSVAVVAPLPVTEDRVEVLAIVTVSVLPPVVVISVPAAIVMVSPALMV